MITFWGGDCVPGSEEGDFYWFHVSESEGLFIRFGVRMKRDERGRKIYIPIMAQLYIKWHRETKIGTRYLN